LPDRKRVESVPGLTSYEAVRLFVERAQAVKVDFAVSEQNADAVAEICHRLDGLPLAIELAAARVNVFSPQAMLARLEHRLAVLTGGPRDLPARQQTLRQAIAWSYELLTLAEQALYRRLAVFVGGCTLESAEAVIGVEEAGAGLDVIDGIASLVDKSLLRRDEGGDAEPRFRMLETIREYALERLIEWVLPVAEELGCASFLSVPTANAAERQIARHAEGATLEEIYAEQVRPREPVRG